MEFYEIYLIMIGCFIRNNDEQQNKMKKILKYVYNIIIFMIIMWLLINSIMMFIKNKNIINFMEIVFYALYIAQYINSLIFFNKPYLTKKIKENNKIKCKLNISCIISFSISFLVAIILFHKILFNKENNICILNSIFENTNIYNNIIIILGLVISNMSFLFNSCIFAVILFNHFDEVENETIALITYSERETILEKKVSNITSKIVKIQNKYETSISILNRFFTIVYILFFVSLYIVLKKIANDTIIYLDIVNLGIFLIIQIIYLWSIQKMKTYVNDLTDTITNIINKNIYNNREPFDKEILTYSDSESLTDKIIINNWKYTIKTSTQSRIMVGDIYEHTQWKYLQEISQIKWKTFAIFGIELDDSALLQKLLGIIIAIFLTKELIDVDLSFIF